MSKPYSEMSVEEKIEWNLSRAKDEEAYAARMRGGYKADGTRKAKMFRKRAKELQEQLSK